MITDRSDLGQVFNIWERMDPKFREKHPECINDQGHYFKTCGTCFTMVCRRCGYKTLDFLGSMTTTYGDFSGTFKPYDRYCDECKVLLQRGTEGWKCYEDYENHRINTNNTLCDRCNGNGKEQKWWSSNELITCMVCEGDGKFPSKYRRTQIEQGKKITEIIDESFWKRTKDWMERFIYNINPWSIGTVTKLKKLNI